ncbi:MULTISPECIES: hypothetical protein [unclassified Synechococcus]|uniref:hypothetical protein n=1 Tax=unclassified Synechococcus TaxID=2626047 RepID=UPI0021A8A8A5|nr:MULTISPECIES: hypothetical protein [unclassified Synechococcus]MCT0212363.1 hypothetical protein [Synechococcus sp. CS-1326]MCT0234224.1 hypothetical protein [Synechococcus sp. CS-1327]
MPFWLAMVLLSASVLLWVLGSANGDDVIGLLEHILSVAFMAIALLAGHFALLELAGIGLACWLPSARQRQTLESLPQRGDGLMPY